MCWTPLYAQTKTNKTQYVLDTSYTQTLRTRRRLNRTTQYVLDTSICKQKQITRNSERKDT